jgi:hypothetical protein
VTVRERIAGIQVELGKGALTPDMVRESEVVLTAILGNVSDIVRTTDHAFKLVLRDALRTHDKANRARIEAETSDEYVAAREAKDMFNVVTEMIRSCRSYSRSLGEEMRLAR